jgi:hypothetical protein
MVQGIALREDCHSCELVVVGDDVVQHTPDLVALIRTHVHLLPVGPLKYLAFLGF